MKLKKNFSKKHENIVKKFYSSRYNLLGNQIRSVGWGSKKNQNLRFKILLKNINVNKKKILDFGCGFGDLYSFLKKKFGKINYSGYDINKSFIIKNKKKYPMINFFYNKKDIKSFDYIICSGVFSLKTRYSFEYFKIFLKRYFKNCRYGIMINFLDRNNKKKLSKNYYYSKNQILKFVKGLKNCKIVFYENYGLDEFTLQLLKTK